MELEFTPKACRGKNAKFKGHAMLKVPSFESRFSFTSEIGIKIDAEGNVDFGETGPIIAVAKASGLMGKHVTSMFFEHKGSQKKVSKYEDMSCDPDFDPITQELANLMISGFKVGKS